MKKQNVLRLLSLVFLSLAMSQQASANSAFWSWLFGVLNREHGGDRFYSELTVKKAIGEGTVYVEWGRTAYNNQETVINDVNANRAESMTVQSPDNDTANADTSWGTSLNYAPHHYLVVPVPENGWEFENWYTDEDCTQKYTFGSGTTQNFTHEGITYIGYAYEIRSTSRDRNERDKEAIYARFVLNVTIGPRGYSTLYYSNYNFTVPSGVTATTYKLGDGYGKLEESRVYSEGDVIPAGEPVVLQGSAGQTYKFYPVKNTLNVPDPNNILLGTDGAEQTASGYDEYFILSWNSTKGVVGFYWKNPDGSGFTNGAHKAYLALGGASGVKGFDLVGDEATGISDVNDNLNLTDGPIFNLAGQRVGKMQKGINIVNGKKILK